MLTKQKIANDVNEALLGDKQADIDNYREIVKEKNMICYYVMSLAKYGEIYRLRDASEKFSDDLVRYLFK